MSEIDPRRGNVLKGSPVPERGPGRLSGIRIKRASGLSMALAVAFVLVGLSEARLQAVESGSVLSKARKSQHFVMKRPEPARRGTILAADGQPLAEDQQLSRLTLTFKNLPKVPGFFADLAVATGISEAQLESAAQSEKSVEWELPLTNEQSTAVASVRTRWNAGGLGIERAFGRRYPLESMAAGIVGRLRDGMKPDGLEGRFDQDLTGVSGVKVGLVDRSGSFLPTRLSSESREAFDGQSVETTIDSDLQVAASQAIRDAVETHHADRGAAVVLDPRTGDILAVANWPSYDPQPVPGSAPLAKSSDLDLAYMGRIEPGSMLKVLTLAKLIDTSGLPKAITCEGQIEVAGHFIRCDDHAGARAHGTITSDLAIARSCNVSAATWGMQIGVAPYYQYLKRLGLLEDPGLGLRGEVKGYARANPPAPKLEVANWGFGQSITSTPLALADALSCLANDGARMRLRLVKRVGEKLSPPVSAGQMVSTQAARIVLHDMEEVFTDSHGTGHDLRIPGYRMAGKTGTAQIANKGGQYVANFIGFLPAEKPSVEILVMVERPTTGGYYGAGVAGPAFKAIAKAAIRRFGMQPDAQNEANRAGPMIEHANPSETKNLAKGLVKGVNSVRTSTVGPRPTGQSVTR